MARFFIIDQSLTAVGGHHFDYMRLVAQAAHGLGFDVVMGVNQTFRDRASLQRYGEIGADFRDRTYCKFSLLAGMREITRSQDFQWPEPYKASGILKAWRKTQIRKIQIRRRSNLIRRFAEDCDRFFNGRELADEDHILLVTMNELEFMGLAAYLANTPRTLAPRWHVQFHFSIMSGRPYEYERQTRDVQAVTNCFQTALSRIPYHEIHAYTTSEQLADQYNRMGVLPFEPLAYPVDPQLFEFQNDSRNPQTPLQLTLPGAVRREKGQRDYAIGLINQLWDSQLSSGKMRVNIQSASDKWFKKARVFDKRESAHVSQDLFEKSVNILPHPLDESDYMQLIGRSDIGVMCYDSHRYFSRRAGILGEFLAAGKPVIVPAGCWLSEQIAEANFQHCENMIDSAADRHTLRIAETEWSSRNVPLPGGMISFDQDRTPFECSTELPTELDENQPSSEIPIQISLVVTFQWQWPVDSGSYVKIDLRTVDQMGVETKQQSQVVGARVDGDEPLVLFQIPANTDKVHLTIRNAFYDASLSVANAQLHFLRHFSRKPVPQAAVGLIVPDARFLKSAVDEMVNHYQHYLVTAVDFAQTWSSRHDPVRTLDCLVNEPLVTRRAA